MKLSLSRIFYYFYNVVSIPVKILLLKIIFLIFFLKIFISFKINQENNFFFFVYLWFTLDLHIEIVIFWVVDICDMNVVGEKCVWLQKNV